MLIATLPPLIEAIFIKRKNRFIAIIEYQGENHEAHLPSTGRMQELLFNGATVFLERHNDQKRKTKFTLRMVSHNNVLIDIYAAKANSYFRKIVEKGLSNLFPTNKLTIKNEWAYENHKFDFLIATEKMQTVVEVKSVNLVENNCALFPDAPTSRGSSHLRSLSQLAQNGYNCIVSFIVMRNDAENFSFHGEKDPEFYRSAIEAQQNGVKFCVFKLLFDRNSVQFCSEIPIIWEK
ncbi:MAG: DNA/RNA nuclease SfsA [Nitrospinae bacterium]|nr:DNA/RNA nuclease SfsA [Nitrospinota bacterium]